MVRGADDAGAVDSHNNLSIRASTSLQKHPVHKINTANFIFSWNSELHQNGDYHFDRSSESFFANNQWLDDEKHFPSRGERHNE